MNQGQIEKEVRLASVNPVRRSQYICASCKSGSLVASTLACRVMCDLCIKLQVCGQTVCVCKCVNCIDNHCFQIINAIHCFGEMNDLLLEGNQSNSTC